MLFFFFFFNDTATTEIYTLSLHDALPILDRQGRPALEHRAEAPGEREGRVSERLVVIGAIARAHGLSGEVRVTPMTAHPERFARLRECLLWDTARDRREQHRITAVRRPGTASPVAFQA